VRECARHRDDIQVLPSLRYRIKGHNGHYVTRAITKPVRVSYKMLHKATACCFMHRNTIFLLLSLY